MLRQALVDAETAQEQRAQQQAQQQQSTEATVLLHSQYHNTKQQQQQQQQNKSDTTAIANSVTSQVYHYTGESANNTTTSGTDVHTHNTVSSSSIQSGSYVEDDEDDDEDYDDDDDSESDDDDDDDDDIAQLHRRYHQQPIIQRIWNGIKTLVRVVANVENLWDSPPQPFSSTSSNTTTYGSTTGGNGSSASYYNIQQQNQYHNNRRRNVVLFWFVVLASSYAGERSTFKLLVDRAGPFRLFSIQVITISHIILLGCGLLISYYTKLHQQQRSTSSISYERPIFMPLGIPIVDCILMAILDTIALIIVFLTGAHVPPTLTVILVQFTIPLTAFLTQFIHPDGKFTCCTRTSSTSNTESYNNNNNNSNYNNSDPTNFGNNYDEYNPILDGGRNTNNNNNTIDKNLRNQQQYQSSFGAHNDIINGNTQYPPPPSIMIYDERLPGWGGLAAAHVFGSLILFLAVTLALIPAFYSIANPDFFIYADAIPTRTAINTIVFVFSCFPAAASQLYKEHIFLQYRQPVNMGYLNLILCVFQFILVSVISPIAYSLQGLGFRGDWNRLYPASKTGDNFVDGVKCFFGFLDEDDQENKYPEDAQCRLTFLLALLYVFSIIAVGVSVDKIVNAGATKVMYRGISAGIIVAVLSMHYYDMHITDFSYGPAIDALNLVCLLLLVVGAEVYHRSSLQESTFETIYPDVMMPTFDD